jgi:prophage antirepressor-like protein
MNNQITPFLFEGNSVRTAVVNTEIYFCAKDLTSLLGYSDHKDALKFNCDKEIIESDDNEITVESSTPIFLNIEVADSLGRLRPTKFINEDNMWSLVLGAKIDRVKEMKNWILDEVYPALKNK